MIGFSEEPEFCIIHGYDHMRKRNLRDRIPYCAACESEATCNHWPGQKRCGVCGMEEMAGMLADATRRLEDSNDILARLIDAEAILRAINHTLTVHGHVDCETPLHDRITKYLSTISNGDG